MRKRQWKSAPSVGVSRKSKLGREMWINGQFWHRACADGKLTYVELEAEVARLREALREVYGHTACVVTQSIDCDDQIIIGHCRDAAAIARAALKAKENN